MMIENNLLPSCSYENITSVLCRKHNAWERKRTGLTGILLVREIKLLY